MTDYPRAPGVVDEPVEDWVKRDVILKSKNIKKIPPRYSSDYPTYTYQFIRYNLVGAIFDSGLIPKAKAFYKSRGLNVQFRKMGGRGAKFGNYHLVYVSSGKWHEGHTSSRSMIP
jgi:hypothetical protein